MLKRAAMAATANVALAAYPLPFARRHLSHLARASWMAVSTVQIGYPACSHGKAPSGLRVYLFSFIHKPLKF